MALDIKRFTARFVEEARDHLGRIEQGLAALGTDATDQEAINSIFRSAHTIKGSSRMLKLGAINEQSHKLEDVLGALRDGSLAYSHELGQLLQRAIDAIAGQIENVAEGREASPPDSQLCAELTEVLGLPAEPPGVEVIPQAVPVEAQAQSADVKLKTTDSVRISLDKLDELIKLMGEMVSSHARLRQRMSDIRVIERGLGGHNPQLVEFAQNLKDDVQTQEALMNELHGKALVLRMLPLQMVFEPAPRMVRDLARTVGKEVECVIGGSEIELDRQLIDRLGDPILHLLRNAIDHGVETPEERIKAGKRRHGRINLSARQDAAGVIIEVSDDGRGLSLAAIRDKAVKKGIGSAEQVAAMSDAEAVDLIFQPGFSTSQIITDISGRGVGLDVVKRCVVDELQGAIHVESKPGVGTTFALTLPRSLAVIRVLLVAAGDQVLGFTAPHVSQLLRAPASDLLEVAERHAVIIHNEFVPVLSLAEMLSLPARPLTGDLLMVVVQSGNEKLALCVDDLVDERNMVIKPLPPHLTGLPLVAGMVMTGKNKLVNILQASALIAQARHASTVRKDAARAGTAAQVRVLVVDDSLNTREIEKDVLEAHGYHVTLAEDGLDGLAKARNVEFDAVLTDVKMPNMDGFSLTTALREDERYRDVPIIIITSRQKEEDQRRGIQVGADAYIVKGDFDQSRLIDTLKSLLG